MSSTSATGPGGPIPSPGVASSRGPAWARGLSTAGHPALLVPLGVAGDALARGGSTGSAWVAGGTAALLAAAVAFYSVWRVRRGDWVDADASRPGERRQLQRILLPVLALPAGILAAVGAPRPWVLQFAVGAAIVLAARSLARRQKMSLHVAFGMFAMARFGPTPLGLAGTALVMAVAVARVALRRHTWAEVATGGAVGGLAALLVRAC